MRSTSGTFSSVASLPDERPALRMLAGVRWGMLVAALLLSAVGLVTVNSASAELGIDYLPRQALWVGLGLVVFVISFSFDYQTLTKFSVIFYVASLILLTLVLILGKEAGGARSWLGFGGSWSVTGSSPMRRSTFRSACRIAPAAGPRRPCGSSHETWPRLSRVESGSTPSSNSAGDSWRRMRMWGLPTASATCWISAD